MSNTKIDSDKDQAPHVTSNADCFPSTTLGSNLSASEGTESII
jgi:hypothetical protein